MRADDPSALLRAVDVVADAAHPDEFIFAHGPTVLLGDLCRCALRALTRYFEVVTGSALTPGVIAAIQTFGNRINLPPTSTFR